MRSGVRMERRYCRRTETTRYMLSDCADVVCVQDSRYHMYDTIYISITVSGVRVYAAQLVEHRLHSGNGHAPGTRFGLRFEYCIIQRNSYF